MAQTGHDAASGWAGNIFILHVQKLQIPLAKEQKDRQTDEDAAQHKAGCCHFGESPSQHKGEDTILLCSSKGRWQPCCNCWSRGSRLQQLQPAREQHRREKGAQSNSVRISHCGVGGKKSSCPFPSGAAALENEERRLEAQPGPTVTPWGQLWQGQGQPWVLSPAQGPKGMGTLGDLLWSQPWAGTKG